MRAAAAQAADLARPWNAFSDQAWAIRFFSYLAFDQAEAEKVLREMKAVRDVPPPRL